MDIKDTMLNVLIKLELLPAIIALRASTQPKADPEHAHKALECAQQAHDLAKAKGGDIALLSQCTYYIAVANVAVGNPDQTKTIRLFNEALDAKGVTPEGDWADSWIDYVHEQQRLKNEEKETSSRPSSVLGQLMNQAIGIFGGSPNSSAGGSRPSFSSKRPSSRAGLYEQMVGPRRVVLATRPAAKRMTLLTDSSGSLPRSLQAAQSKPADSAPYAAYRLTAVSDDQSRRRGSSYPARLLRLAAAPRDSQGNFTHRNTSLKYNEDRPFGVDVEFVASPEKYEDSFCESSPQSPPQQSPPSLPPRRKYYIVNPDPRTGSSSTASVCASHSTKLSGNSASAAQQGDQPFLSRDSANPPMGESSTASVGAAPSISTTTSSSPRSGEQQSFGPEFAAEEDITPSKRRTSWMQRLSMSISTDREAGSPTKSLEAMAEEGESPMFKPKDFGDLSKRNAV